MIGTNPVATFRIITPACGSAGSRRDVSGQFDESIFGKTPGSVARQKRTTVTLVPHVLYRDLCSLSAPHQIQVPRAQLQESAVRVAPFRTGYLDIHSSGYC